MKKPVLVVMAAGMASRYGGAKQVAPVDPEGHVLLDFSVYDAHRAGFDEVIFIIRESLQRDFDDDICPNIDPYMTTKLVYQRLTDLPEGFTVPEGRTKPWGTTHAVLCAEEAIDGRPFAVLNADDFYGLGAFEAIYRFLTENDDPKAHALAGYHVENTLSDNGIVTRGVCDVDGSTLVECHERYGIYPVEGGAKDRDGRFFPTGTFVSMNFWGFKPGIFEYLRRDFTRFLGTEAKDDPMKSESLLPNTPSELIESGEAKFTVLPVSETWSGITYKEDMPGVQARIAALKAEGRYPRFLWKKA